MNFASRLLEYLTSDDVKTPINKDDNGNYTRGGAELEAGLVVEYDDGSRSFIPYWLVQGLKDIKGVDATIHGYKPPEELGDVDEVVTV